MIVGTQNDNDMKLLKSLITTIIIASTLAPAIVLAQAKREVMAKPVKIGVVNLTHGHVGGILHNFGQRTDIEIVGIAEPDRKLAETLSKAFGFPMDLYYSSAEAMMDSVKPEAVVDFGSIYGHLATVEAAAPRGIHVMVEKPLAVSMTHATRMAQLARTNGIHLLTNYETTWYPSHYKAYEMVKNDFAAGQVFKYIVYDGHGGPIEIGCDHYFTDWLTDPTLNGGGAIVDFGCYGANLVTWFRDGQKPEAVYAKTKQFKPAVYPKVDDDASIYLSYPDAEAAIYASWCWAIGRKDMHIYGQKANILIDNSTDIRFRNSEKSPEELIIVDPLKDFYSDGVSYFAAIVRNRLTMKPFDLSSLENNLIVVEILDAARESAKTGKPVKLK